MSRVKTEIIGPPGYASPDPKTQGGMLVPIEEHPLKDSISPDFGKGIRIAPIVDATAEKPLVVKTAGENRDSWNKAQWVSRASALGLKVPKDTKKDGIIALVKDHETWLNELNAVVDQDKLAEIATKYGVDAENFTDAEALKAAIVNAELN